MVLLDKVVPFFDLPNSATLFYRAVLRAGLEHRHAKKSEKERKDYLKLSGIFKKLSLFLSEFYNALFLLVVCDFNILPTREDNCLCKKLLI